MWQINRNKTVLITFLRKKNVFVMSFHYLQYYITIFVIYQRPSIRFNLPTQLSSMACI